MAKRPLNFNWRESLSHFLLLNEFVKRRDVIKICSRYKGYESQTFGEKAIHAIDRFVREGLLIPADIEETLECILQSSQLKKLLQERNLKLTGSKSELIERLVLSDRSGMEKVAQQCRVMKCSQVALEILSEQEKKKQLAFDSARNETFEAFRSNKLEDACRIYATYQRSYKFPEFRFRAYHDDVETLQFVLQCHPEILLTVPAESLVTLKAIAAMHLLWFGEELFDDLLSLNNLSGLKNDRIAINYIIVNAEISYSKAQQKKYNANQVKIVFDMADIDSCDLCRSLDGKIFDVDKVPNLPMIGCTSETGCKCRIDSDYCGNEEFCDESYSEDDVELSPISKLRQLKQMLDEKLITNEEFEKKKTELLLKI